MEHTLYDFRKMLTKYYTTIKIYHEILQFLWPYRNKSVISIIIIS